MVFYGDPFSLASAWDEDNEIGGLWKRFFSFLSEHPGTLRDRAGPGEAGYELHIHTTETPRTGRYEIFVGVETRSLDFVPVPCSAKVLPAADYAVVTARGAEIEGDWTGRLYSELIPGLGRRADESFCFEYYDSRFKGMDRLEESEVDFYFPLLPRDGGR